MLCDQCPLEIRFISQLMKMKVSFISQTWVLNTHSVTNEQGRWNSLCVGDLQRGTRSYHSFNDHSPKHNQTNNDARSGDGRLKRVLWEGEEKK